MGEAGARCSFPKDSSTRRTALGADDMWRQARGLDRALQREHSCEGATGATALDLIGDGEDATDPVKIARKFAGSDIRLAAYALRAEWPLDDERCDHSHSILSHAALPLDGDSRERV
jgi:hypothetical protein